MVCVASRAFPAATIERWAVLLGVAQGIPASADEEELRRLFVGAPCPLSLLKAVVLSSPKGSKLMSIFGSFSSAASQMLVSIILPVVPM